MILIANVTTINNFIMIVVIIIAAIVCAIVFCISFLLGMRYTIRRFSKSVSNSLVYALKKRGYSDKTIDSILTVVVNSIKSF